MKTISFIIIASSLFACAIPRTPTDYSLIDPKGVDMDKYRADYYECEGITNSAHTMQSVKEHRDTMRACLTGRGYSVIR